MSACALGIIYQITKNFFIFPLARCRFYLYYLNKVSNGNKIKLYNSILIRRFA